MFYDREKHKIVNAAKVAKIKESDEPVSKKAKVEADETTLVQKVRYILNCVVFDHILFYIFLS